MQQGKHTQEIMLIVRSRFLYHMCDLVHSLSGIQTPMNLINVLTILESFYRMFEKARGCTLTKGIWFVA